MHIVHTSYMYSAVPQSNHKHACVYFAVHHVLYTHVTMCAFFLAQRKMIDTHPMCAKDTEQKDEHD